MIVIWNGTDLFKGYHDPDSGWLDLVSSRPAEGGQAFTVGEGFSLSVDEGGSFCHLGLNVDDGGGGPMPTRPPEVREALDAEVHLSEDSPPRWAFDPSTGSLCVSFQQVLIDQWGRIGDNLLWLGLDDEGRLAVIVFEGVSRDPGGKGQATWLEEVGA